MVQLVDLSPQQTKSAKASQAPTEASSYMALIDCETQDAVKVVNGLD